MTRSVSKIRIAETGSILEEFFPAFDPETGEIFDPAIFTEADSPDEQGIIGRMRLSLSTMGCNPSMAKTEGTVVPLAVIIAQVQRLRDIENPRKGEADQPDTFLALTGFHEGMNIQKGMRFYGKRFRSNVLFLPSDLNQQFGESFRDLVGPDAKRARPGEWRGIQFAMQLYSEPSANKAGYTYYWRPLTKTGLPDPLAAIRHETMQLLAAEKRLLEQPMRPADSAC
jgi:hypothetical protein